MRRKLFSSKTGVDNIVAEPKYGGLSLERRFTQEGVDPFATVTFEKRKSIIRDPDGTTVFEMKEVEVPSTWSQVATDVLAQKYFRKAGVPKHDENGNPILQKDGTPATGGETSLRQVVHRIVGCWRFWGEQHGYFATPKDARIFYDELVYMMIHQMAAPNSPQWFNTGLHWAYGINGPAQGHYYVDAVTKVLTKSEDSYSRPQPHACFIQQVNDDLVNEGGIMDLWIREARLFKYGSGTGTNFSNLRGSEEPLSGGGKSSGVMSFLKIGDRAAGAIKSGGTTRRAAKMVILDADHPDIEQFINWKVSEERKVAAMVEAGYSAEYEGEAYQTVSGQNANNTVRLSAEFFDALESGADWALTWRTTGETARMIAASALWEQIGDAAWACADPGVQYSTTINEWHTCPQSGPIRASNPCSEYMFLDNTACNLASLNFMKFYDTEARTFAIDDFRHATRLWTMVLEVSVLMAQFPSKEIAQLSFEYRTLGLGYANLGTLLMAMGIPYDSKEATTVSAAVTAIMTGTSYHTSAEMARHLGTFSGFDKNRGDMLRVMRNHRRAAYNAPAEDYEQLTITPYGIDATVCPADLLASAQQGWDEAVVMGERWGYRNAQATAIAPTGTIGLVMDCDTTGVEPDFALVKFKKLSGGGYFKIVNQSVAAALKNLGYTADQVKAIMAYIGGHATLAGAPFVTAANLEEKGMTKEEVARVEKELVKVLDINAAFALAGFDSVTFDRLGIAEEEYTQPGFSLLTRMGFTEEEIEEASVYACGTMTVEGAPHLREEHYAIFDCANRCGAKGKRFIAPMGHVRILAAVQPFVSGSISKTINLPNEATVDEVLDVFKKGWAMGLKANALYRDGCKMSQPLSTSSSKKQKETLTEEVTVEKKEVQTYGPVRRRMPQERNSITHKFEINNHEGYITVGMYEDGMPGEIFITMNKEGSVIAGLLDAFAKSISWSLQYGVPLKALVNTFIHSRFEPAGYTTHPNIRIAKSIIDYLFRWLGLKFLPTEDWAMLGLNDIDTQAIEEREGKMMPSARQESTEPDIVVSAKTTTTITETTEKNVFEPASVILDNTKDAPVCDTCGSMMIRNGTCYKCLNCGSTSGCS